ncbi:serine/threonine protein kinase [Hahella sp. KA22]|uniref:protein kinase domain-containing protein n=1 Tax=Hahella sp. KA22 TaxID=1628392 RepID=UPI000FDD6861|nr:serine/threonine-protein kinase [Hahella sp. KA22]AZZ95180.1 serine/threonine protein kinase [Hahella sp. KA22]QAY52825.1 serine/threonine protein kinase [Hahella sp. KA22]
MAWQGYKVLSKLGEGGMATVYKALQESLQRPVAIKILSANLKDHPEILERFEKESLIIAQLNHPHIIHVIDKGVTGKGRPYFVMEYVEGMTLEDAINRGKLDFSRKMDVLVQLCKALAYAHKNGVIHRDIKPSNILIDNDWQARVLDFGIAHFYDSSSKQKTLHTETSNIMGTSAYMAPEQHKSADAASVQSDIYALGILMYELFTGVCPQGEIPPPRKFEPELAPALNSLIMRCLEKDPSERPASADEVKNGLLHILQGGHLSKAQKARALSNSEAIESKFSLLDVLKEDRHSSVYLYEDQGKQKLLIMKKLPGDTPGIKEHKLLARLNHPNICKILAVSKVDKGYVIVTEYLPGGSMAEQMLAPLPAVKVVEWAEQIAEGLAFAHRNRIVHGNLRPSNLLLDEEGVIKLTDFGLRAHYTDSDEPNWYENADAQGILGDMFALGAICYHALTGQPPVIRGQRLVRSKRFTELHNRLQELITRLLETRPEKRYPSLEVAMADIRGVLKSLRAQTAAKQTEAIKKHVSQVAKKERRYRPPVRWGRVIFFMLVVGVAVEEYFWGYGYRYLKPYIDPYLQQMQESDAWIEWSEKAKEVGRKTNQIDW